MLDVVGVDTVAVTAATLTGVQETCRSVRYQLLLMGVSSGDGLTKGVAFVPMVLKMRNTLTEMVLKRG